MYCNIASYRSTNDHPSTSGIHELAFHIQQLSPHCPSGSTWSIIAAYGTQILPSANKLNINSFIVEATPVTSVTAYTYIFSSWEDDCGSILTGNCTITAIFDRVYNQYTVTFVDDDWHTLKDAALYSYGTPATEIVQPNTPEKVPTAEYTYTFAWWNPELSEVTGNIIYNATYTRERNKYNIYINSNNTNSWVVDINQVNAEYWTTISINWTSLTIGDTTIIATPTEDDDQYDYSFDSWTNSCWNTLTTWCNITANFSSVVKQHTANISSNNTDYGTVSKSSITADYGTSISIISQKEGRFYIYPSSLNIFEHLFTTS